MNHLVYFWYGLKKIYNPVIEDMGAREQREHMLSRIDGENKTHSVMHRNPVEKHQEFYVSRVKDKKIVRNSI